MTTVSVIIPTYNHARYLPDAINSVLAQSSADMEIIVIDDGSTDNTREVAARFGQAIHYIYQENRGLSAARNTGLRHASGSYIVILDADDLLDPRYFQEMVPALEATPDAVAACCGFKMVDPDLRPLFQQSLPHMTAPKFYEEILKANFAAPPCLMIRSERYREIGYFDESLSACEDWDMWLRIGHGASVIPVKTLLVKYRIRPGSMSSDPALMLANRLLVLDKQKDTVSDSQLRRATGYAFRATALEWLQLGDLAQTLACLCEAAEYYPPLLVELETYYELALWDQAKGRRGDLADVDIPLNQKRLMELLNMFFALPNLSDSVRSRQKSAVAEAYYALGLISYGKRNMSLARRYLFRSVRTSPHRLGNSQFGVILAKTWIKRPNPIPV